jgi:hypothetical protein
VGSPRGRFTEYRIAKFGRGGDIVTTAMDMKKIVGFEVLTAVVRKSIIFWDITPCSPLKVNRYIG